MELTANAVRIYGIEKDDEKAFSGWLKDCINKQIKIENYPKKGECIKICFGDPVKSFFEINNTLWERIGRGFGFTSSEPKISDHHYYITLILEKSVQINIDEKEVDSEFYLVPPDESKEIGEDLKSYALKYLDILTNHISLTMDVNFFKNVIFNDKIFVFSQMGKNLVMFWMGNPSGSVRFIPGSPLYDYEYLDNYINKAKSNGFKSLELLERASHFRISAFSEDDPWKHYYWSFNALEILTEKWFKNKIAKKKIAYTILNSKFLDTSSYQLKELDLKNINLKEKFGIIALNLFPEDAKNDCDTFLELKIFRDKMSHGKPIKENELPINRADGLLNKYFKRITELNLDVTIIDNR